MADSWFTLSREDQAEALEVAAAQTGRPAHLLEKDIWVVWTLSAIYESALAEKLTFKGGTSLSKVYKIIDRFSEDIDLTYDIREVVPDLLRDGNPIPASASQAKKITDRVRDRLPQWIEGEVLPILLSALTRDGLQANLSLAGNEKEKLILAYEPIKVGTGYAASTIQLEFGGRATGEPHQRHAVTCDMAPAINGILFPTAQPLVMAAERTFWEKATLIHVECHRPSLRPSAERLSRHWYDLARLADHEVGQQAMGDSELLRDVLRIKETFYRSGFSHYDQCIAGGLRLIPDEPLLDALRQDYQAMLAAQMFYGETLQFETIVERLQRLEAEINSIGRS